MVAPKGGVLAATAAMATTAAVAAAAGASLRVGAPDAKRVEWGAAPLVFDDSFEHHVRHDGAEDRYVLFAILKHPDVEEGLYG